MKELKRKSGYKLGVLILALVLVGMMRSGLLYPVAQNEKTTYLTVCKRRNCRVKEKPFGVGKSLYFGSYEQDGNKKNKKEKIEWTVLAVEKDKALVISKNILDIRAYHKENADNDDVVWANSSIRRWLNKEFLNTAFSKEERKNILKTLVLNKDIKEGKIGGKDTEDKIFLLSEEEAEKYFKSDSNRVSEFTGYSAGLAKKISVDNHYFTEETFENFVIRDGKSRWFWWLRGQGEGVYDAVCVEDNGKIEDSGYLSSYKHGGVRPVMWIKRK